MISEELTNLMIGAQTVATKYEELLSEESDNPETKSMDFPASFVGRNPDTGIGVTPLDQYIDDKEKLAQVYIPAAIRTHKFEQCVLTFTAWMVLNPSEQDMDTRPSEHPDRQEIYFVVGFENGRSVMTRCSVDRSGPAPQLQSWEPIEESENMLGLFPEPILATLKEVANGN